MLKNSQSKFSSVLSGLSVFDKLNVFFVVLFFLAGVILPIATIMPIGESEGQSIRLIGLEYRKTSILIIALLVGTLGISLNGKFKSRVLLYSGITNDIFVRFIQKLFLIFLLIFFGEMVIHLRGTLTQTINISRGYYFLSVIVISGLVIDFLFLQRKYKLNSTYQQTQTTISHEESSVHEGQGFKNLFDQ